jgi:hypothetical protein
MKKKVWSQDHNASAIHAPLSASTPLGPCSVTHPPACQPQVPVKPGVPEAPSIRLHIYQLPPASGRLAHLRAHTRQVQDRAAVGMDAKRQKGATCMGASLNQQFLKCNTNYLLCPTACLLISAASPPSGAALSPPAYWPTHRLELEAGRISVGPHHVEPRARGVLLTHSKCTDGGPEGGMGRRREHNTRRQSWWS